MDWKQRVDRAYVCLFGLLDTEGDFGVLKESMMKLPDAAVLVLFKAVKAEHTRRAEWAQLAANRWKE